MTTPTTVPVRLQLRADTAANWTSINPILLANELGRETDTGKIKIGNGTSTWTSLAYQAWATLPVAVNAGGTGQTSYTNGQLLIGNTTGNTLTKATLTAGSGVAITNGTGSITVAVDSTVVTTAQTGTVTSTMIADGTIVDADVNASAAIAGTKISPNFGSQNVVTTGTSTAASLIPTGSSVPTNGVYLPAANSVGISTNGTGRLFVDSSGRVLFGASSARTFNLGAGTAVPTVQLESATGLSLLRAQGVATGSVLFLTQARGSLSDLSPVNSGDLNGVISFSGFDGTNFLSSSWLRGEVDGTPGTGSMPGRLVFSTTPSGSGTPLERARIDSSGTFRVKGAGTAGVADAFAVNGSAPASSAQIDSFGRLLVGTATALNVSGSAGFEGLQLAGTASSSSISTSRWSATASSASTFTFARSRGATVGTNTIVASEDRIGRVSFNAADGTSFVDAAYITAEVDGTPGANDMPGRLVFSVTADGASTPTEALRISNNRAITVSDGGNVVLGTTTGTKIGTATTQKLGFYNATPVVQPTAVADATDAATAISQLNALLAHMRTLGLIAT
jgi:ribosomal protein L24E